MLGPLASKRDVGLKQGVYGTIDHVQLKGPELPAAVRKGPKSSGWDIEGREGLEGEGKEWEGEGNWGNIVKDDRIVVANGKEGVVGKIGIVKDVSLETEEVTVEGVNIVN